MKIKRIQMLSVKEVTKWKSIGYEFILYGDKTFNIDFLIERLSRRTNMKLYPNS